MSKKYITLYLPKSRVCDVSQKFLLSELIGEILGPLISLILINIEESNFLGSLKYTHFNCLGYFGLVISLLLLIVHAVFFTKPLSTNFLMVKDEKNITGSKYYQKSEEEINRKQYLKEQNMMYKKKYKEVQKKKLINEEEGNIIVTNSNKNEDKFINNDNNSQNESLEEKLIDTNSNNEKDENSLDLSIGGNIALTSNQKNMINDIEKNLEKKININHIHYKFLKSNSFNT